MSVRIRLARGGTNNRPFHQIVVANKRSPRDGRYIESLGFYNPMLPKGHPDVLRINVDAAKKWMAQGAEVTERVQKLFSTVGLCEKPAPRANQTKKNQPKAKAQERAKEAADRAKEAADADAAAKAEAEKPVEAPAAETAPTAEAPQA